LLQSHGKISQETLGLQLLRHNEAGVSF
jgi:hypothetical protein